MPRRWSEIRESWLSKEKEERKHNQRAPEEVPNGTVGEKTETKTNKTHDKTNKNNETNKQNTQKTPRHTSN